MEKISAYPTDWLETRYPFDAEGRSSQLESAALQYLQTIENPHIVDVGSGYGANYRYFRAKVPAQTQWTLIEHDPLLIEATRQWVPAQVQLQQASLLDIRESVDLSQVDLVMANAVFDLFSAKQFTHFVRPVCKAGLPFYLSLNYTHMGFHPEGNEDEEMIALYDSHMRRPQNFGRAMGADGPKQMAKIFRELGYQLVMAPSYWHIGPENENMQHYLLGFMEEAIGELLGKPTDKIRLQNWIREKKAEVSLGALAIWVRHQDLWAKA